MAESNATQSTETKPATASAGDKAKEAGTQTATQANAQAQAEAPKTAPTNAPASTKQDGAKTADVKESVSKETPEASQSSAKSEYVLKKGMTFSAIIDGSVRTFDGDTEDNKVVLGPHQYAAFKDKFVPPSE